ncbi:glucan endo-1,3-beta-glucosidase 1 isoform X2 [Elaeis guineensis]|uniref:glucan endo-1,3-beta-D-glucosidase n=1 Tax=Elaeis guineensis var. tenera TaxID=51953 RepID=A0A6I9RNW7_ELAGV|nr:glucan endo-1,3-beta-glucosidase 1 isoform X1 [Elaeis guineensis]
MGMTPILSIFHFLFLSLSLSSLFAAAANQSKDEETPFVGVNIGTDVSNLFTPEELVAFLKSQQITHIRLYDADPALLAALAGTGIRVVLGIPNNQLLALGSSNATAVAWVARHVLSFLPSTLISAIAVGDEVPASLPSALPLLLPALRSLSSALSSSADPPIKLSTPLPFSIILDPFPPSQAFFNQTLASSFLLPLLEFLSDTDSPLMLNLYPYYALMQSRGVIPLDNSLFKPLPPSLEEVDPNTLLHYTNVFDAMIDAAYFSMKNLNVTDVPILITETGWPSNGSRKDEPFATKDNADTYNSNVIKHILDRSGTPLHPEITSSVYIYELFNEDLRPGPVSEGNWGLFYGSGTPVYLLHLVGSGEFLATDTTNRTYCVAAEGADGKALQAALDWACGPGLANCSEIQPGESCYEPNNVGSHASYAFDSYYQKEGKVPGSCYFQGVAMVTTTDPGHGDCIFPGSKQESNITNAGANATQASKAEGCTRFRPRKRWNQGLHILYMVMSMMVVVTFSTSNFWT